MNATAVPPVCRLEPIKPSYNEIKQAQAAAAYKQKEKPQSIESFKNNRIPSSFEMLRVVYADRDTNEKKWRILSRTDALFFAKQMNADISIGKCTRTHPFIDS